MFDACIFDLYGTLVDIHTDEAALGVWWEMTLFYRKRGAEYSPLEMMDRYFALVSELEKATGLEHPEIRIEEVFARLFEEKGASADEALAYEAARRFRALSTDYLKLYPGVWDLLDHLRAAGKKVILLSNAQRVFTQAELELLSLTERFDAVFLSSDYGVRKPDPRFFEAMIAGTGIDPARAVMIGNDARCDIEGARAVGLAAVYLRTDRPQSDPWPACDLALMGADYAQLEKFLLQSDK